MHRGWSFSLSSLMLIVTCAAGCAWIGAAVPALGILCGVLAIPALVRTGHLVAQEAAEQQGQIGTALKVLIFFESLLGIGWFAIVCFVCALGFAAGGFALGAAVCAPFASDDEVPFQIGIWLGIALGAGGGIAMLFSCIRNFGTQRHIFFPSESTPRRHASER